MSSREVQESANSLATTVNCLNSRLAQLLVWTERLLDDQKDNEQRADNKRQRRRARNLIDMMIAGEVELKSTIKNLDMQGKNLESERTALALERSTAEAKMKAVEEDIRKMKEQAEEEIRNERKKEDDEIRNQRNEWMEEQKRLAVENEKWQQSGAKILPFNAAVTDLRNETARLRLSENSEGPKKETIVHANKRIRENSPPHPIKKAKIEDEAAKAWQDTGGHMIEFLSSYRAVRAADSDHVDTFDMAQSLLCTVKFQEGRERLRHLMYDRQAGEWTCLTGLAQYGHLKPQSWVDESNVCGTHGKSATCAQVRRESAYVLEYRVLGGVRVDSIED